MTGKHALPYEGTEPNLADIVRETMHGDLKHFMTDIEFRLGQAIDIENRSGGRASGTVYAEDLNLMKHVLTGYVLLSNSSKTGTTSTGNIAWQSLHVVYNGTDYAITDGDTITGGPLKYVWFDPAVSTTVLQQSNTKPDLSTKPNAALLFVNNGGTAYDVLAASIPGVIANGAVDAGAIQQGAVTATKINTIQHLLY
jgi:hypothetical protein